MTRPLRVVHYINQFFAGVGGEEEAGVGPFERPGPVGPGKLLQRLLGEVGEVVATVACGDSHVAEHPDDAVEAVTGLIAAHRPDLVFAGPAFLSGRYGVACAKVAAACEQRGLPCVTGMSPENPALSGAERSAVFAVPTADRATGLAAALEAMVALGRKRASGEPLGPPEAEGYLPRGVRLNVTRDATGAERAVAALLHKLRGEPFETEIPLPTYDRVPPSRLPAALGELEIALVTEAGVVPAGNPDRLESARATHWYKYPLADLDDLRPGEYVTVHGGFDSTHVNEDPDRVLPLDVLRELAAEGVVGRLHDHYYVTTGMATAVAEAERIGREIAEDLRRQRVHAVLVTST